MEYESISLLKIDIEKAKNADAQMLFGLDWLSDWNRRASNGLLF